MVYGLQIDTSGEGGHTGLSRNGRLVRKSPWIPAREQGAKITLQIKELMDREALDWDMIRYISLCSGPGSYTGLRVGYATAKALAYVRKIPLIPISRLQLLSLCSPPGHNAALWIPAREKEYFFALYDSLHQPMEEPVHLMESELINRIESLEAPVWTRGPVPDPGPDSPWPVLDPAHEQSLDIDFSLWAEFALEKYLRGESADIRLCEPEYLKPVFIHPPRQKPFSGA